jgi:hypothetical protein
MLSFLVNFSMDMERPPGANESEINDAERQGLERMQHLTATGSAYAQEHGTRPATIGFVLASSPLALLAWYVGSRGSAVNADVISGSARSSYNGQMRRLRLMTFSTT